MNAGAGSITYSREMTTVGFHELLIRNNSIENTLSNTNVEFLIIEVSEKSTPWWLPLTFDHVVKDRDRREEIGNNWAVIWLGFPFPNDASENDRQRQTRSGTDPNLV